MKKYLKSWRLAVIILCVVCLAVPAAAAVRRVPSNDLIVEGILALEIEAEGTKDFRFKGEEGKYHTYIGQMKPGEKVRITFTEKLGSLKSLPQYKKRSCTAKCDIVAKKGTKILEKKNFRRDNKSNVRFEYDVPKDADIVEMFYTFELKNYKTDGKGVRCRMTNKLMFSADKVPPPLLASKGSSSGGGTIKTVLGLAALGAAGFGALKFLKKRKAAKAADAGEAPLPPMPRPTVEPDVQSMPRPSTEPVQPMPTNDTTGAAAPTQPAATAAGQTAAPRFCTECGTKLTPGAAFCTECGHKLQ